MKTTSIFFYAALFVSACEYGSSSGPLFAQTCGDRFCTNEPGGLYQGPICAVPDGGTAKPSGIGEYLCEYNGQRCSSISCDLDSSHCPAGSSCTGVDSWWNVCVRDQEKVGDRTACQTDAECMQESCCRPTKCVNWSNTECSVDPCCMCDDCRPCITACKCVEGCCVTEYDPDGCC